MDGGESSSQSLKKRDQTGASRYRERYFSGTIRRHLLYMSVSDGSKNGVPQSKGAGVGLLQIISRRFPHPMKRYSPRSLSFAGRVTLSNDEQSEKRYDSSSVIEDGSSIEVRDASPLKTLLPRCSTPSGIFIDFREGQ